MGVTTAPTSSMYISRETSRTYIRIWICSNVSCVIKSPEHGTSRLQKQMMSSLCRTIPHLLLCGAKPRGIWASFTALHCIPVDAGSEETDEVEERKS